MVDDRPLVIRGVDEICVFYLYVNQTRRVKKKLLLILSTRFTLLGFVVHLGGILLK